MNEQINNEIELFLSKKIKQKDEQKESVNA